MVTCTADGDALSVRSSPEPFQVGMGKVFPLLGGAMLVLFVVALARRGFTTDLVGPLVAALALLGFGLLVRRMPTLESTFSKQKRSWRVVAKASTREGTFEQLSAVTVTATANYASVALLLAAGERVSLVVGTARSEEARTQLARLVLGLRELGLTVEVDETAKGAFWKLPA